MRNGPPIQNQNPFSAADARHARVGEEREGNSVARDETRRTRDASHETVPPKMAMREVRNSYHRLDFSWVPEESQAFGTEEKGRSWCQLVSHGRQKVWKFR